MLFQIQILIQYEYLSCVVILLVIIIVVRIVM
jgi:hypothetical protein